MKNYKMQDQVTEYIQVWIDEWMASIICECKQTILGTVGYLQSAMGSCLEGLGFD